jgi:hypothetical protein
MWRLICGVVAGLAVWIAVISLLDRGMRYGWHDYAAVYKAMAFTLPMMIARLSESAVSSLISGYVAALVARGGRAPLVAGTITLIFFIPVHYSIWSHFPIWYHLTFLISLPLLSFLGGRLYRAKPAAAT